MRVFYTVSERRRTASGARRKASEARTEGDERWDRERSEDIKREQKTYGIAGVGQGAKGLGLGADDGTRADLGGAPVLAQGQRDRVGRDVVVGADGGDEGGSNGQDGEFERRHCCGLWKRVSVCQDRPVGKSER